MRGFILTSILVCLVGGIACSPNQSPDEIRRQTAEETARLKQDTTAVAQGVKEGLRGSSKDAPLDINSASERELKALPGMDEAAADRVIAKRPYDRTHELVTRRALSEDEYNRIKDQIAVGH